MKNKLYMIFITQTMFCVNGEPNRFTNTMAMDKKKNTILLLLTNVRLNFTIFFLCLFIIIAFVFTTSLLNGQGIIALSIINKTSDFSFSLFRSSLFVLFHQKKADSVFRFAIIFSATVQQNNQLTGKSVKRKFVKKISVFIYCCRIWAL